MEIETVVFRDPGFETKAKDYPKIRKAVEMTVEVPIARNVSHIEEGELLVLPFDAEWSWS